MRSVVFHPRLASFQRFSTRSVNQGADESPAAKALSGWRALTGATGQESLSGNFLRASGAIGSAIDCVCLGLGSQASSGQWIRLRRPEISL